MEQNFKLFFQAILFLSALLFFSLHAREYGAQEMVSPLQTVLVKSPDSAFVVDDPDKWHYTATPNLEIAEEEHKAFVSLLKEEGVEVIDHCAHLPNLADAIYVHDPALITNKGAIILRMGKSLRNGEEEAIEKCLNQLGIPTYYKLSGNATAEGGDLLWLDEKTLAIGLGYRTNEEGFNQLKNALAPLDVTVIPVQLPHWEGEVACLHLMSLISLVDRDKAVVYLPLLSVPFVKLLHERGYQLIEVPDEEFLTMGPNVLAIRPSVVLTLEGNPKTKERMELAGIRVLTYKGNEISLKAEGGATCLTRPLLRK